MKLETPRLQIREITMEDWTEIHRYASDPEVTRYMMWGPNTEEDTKIFVEEQLNKQQMKDRTGYELGVLVKETGEWVGGCSLYVEGRNAEIGYCFNPDYWGNGYATEAAQTLLGLAFDTFGVHRVFATCRPGNMASANVMRRIGMKQEGHLREHMWHKGRYHDSYLFSILEHEYRG